MSLAFSSGIEITQYITGRGLCEFDDVSNNTLGLAWVHILAFKDEIQ